MISFAVLCRLLVFSASLNLYTEFINPPICTSSYVLGYYKILDYVAGL